MGVSSDGAVWALGSCRKKGRGRRLGLSFLPDVTASCVNCSFHDEKTEVQKEATCLRLYQMLQTEVKWGPDSQCTSYHRKQLSSLFFESALSEFF